MDDILIRNKIKIYPSFKKLVEFKTPLVNINAFMTDLDKIARKRKNNNSAPAFESLIRSKVAIKDIVISNNFELFCTFTFAKNRDDMERCLNQFKQWLKNQKLKSPDLAYLAVPEYHKDKKAIHFHVLLKNYNGVLKNSQRRSKSGQPIYNIKSYRLGFTTAVKINNADNERIANYITKYITKDLICKYNKKRYWCSRGLIRPEEYSNILAFKKYAQPDKIVFENEAIRIYKHML